MPLLSPGDYVPESRTVEIGEVGDLTDADCARMTVDELLRRKAAIGLALEAIGRQLRHADHLRQRKNILTNQVWLRSAKNAQAMYGQQIVLIQAEFARRRGGTKTERKTMLQKEFVNVAREKLSEPVFKAWLDEAARRLRVSGLRGDDAPDKGQTPFQRQLRIESARLEQRNTDKGSPTSCNEGDE